MKDNPQYQQLQVDQNFNRIDTLKLARPIALFLYFLSTFSSSYAGERDPFQLETEVLHYFDETIESSPYQDCEIGASRIDVTGRVRFPLLCDTFGSVDLSYQHFHLNWDHNPYWQQTNFESLGATLGLMTTRWNNWIWRGAVGFSGPVNEVPFYRYIQLRSLIWGQYCCSDCWNFHLGFLSRFGLKNNRYLPLLGFEYIRGDWTYSAIFPMKIGVEYRLNCCWTVSALGSFINEMHQVASSEPLPDAIFRYRNIGTVLNLTYQPNDCSTFELFGGKVFSSELEVMTSNGNEVETVEINSPWMMGVKAQYSF